MCPLKYIRAMLKSFRQSIHRLLLAVFLFYACFQVFVFLNKGLPTIAGFVEAGADHDVVRERKVPYFREVQAASALIPSGASVTYRKDNVRMIDVIAIRYALYPVRVADQAQYVLDLTGDRVAGSDWTVKTLFNDAKLYAQPGYPFLNPQHKAKRSRIVEFAVFLLVSVVISLTGSNFLRAIGIGSAVLGRVWFLGTAYLTGFVVFNWAFWICLMVGVLLDLPVVLGVVTIVFVISMVSKRMSPKERSEDAGTSINIKHNKSSWPQPVLFAMRSLTAFVLIMVVLLICAIPLTVWDEMLMWVLKAKMIFYDGRIDFHYLDVTHVYYPNLWPLHIHIFFKAVGGCYSEVLKWVSASVFLAFVSQIMGALRSLNFKSLLSGFAVSVYLLVFMNFIFFTALPENIFYALSLCMVAALVLWLRDVKKTRFLLLAAVMAFGLSGVKFEGGLLIFAVGVCAALAGLLSGLSLKSLPGLLWLLVPGAVPWLWTVWLKQHGYPYSIYHFANPPVLENISAITVVVLRSLSQWENILLLSIMSGVFITAGNRRPWDVAERFLALTVLVFVGFSVSSVIFWPANDIALYFPEVLDRLFLRAAPFVMLFWAGRVFNRTSS